MNIWETMVVQQLTPQRPVLFDIGANVGDWTNMALKCRPQCTLHAFEPSNAAHRYRSRYNTPNIHFNHCAVSDQDSHITLYEHTTDTVYCCMIPQSGHIAKIVPSITVDAYCQRHNIDHIDLLKIDVEGAELLVLKGAHEFLTNRRIAYIQFEFNICAHKWGYAWSDVVKQLQPYGLRFYHIYKHGLHPVGNTTDDMDMTISVLPNGQVNRQANVIATYG